MVGNPAAGQLLDCVVGALGLGFVGAVVGLVVGLSVYVPTAAFAAVEIGLLSALVGALIGALALSVVSAAARLKRTSTQAFEPGEA